MTDFKDRIVVVTGAASGIGREIALAFARRGAHLAVIDVDETGLARVRQELEGEGCLVYSEVVDVSRADEMEHFRDNVFDRFGRCDVLVNNAGIAIGGPMEHIPLEGWQRIVGINLWGVIHGCHFFYPRMIAQGGGGSIVNIASSAALAPGPHLAAYACTKHGVLGLAETMRIEGAQHGINVSTICPGMVDTPIYGRIEMNVDGGRVTAEDITTMMRTIVRKYGCHPEKIALAVIDAVERDRGVVPVGPGARPMDYSRRLSREFYNRSVRAATRLADWAAKRKSLKEEGGTARA